MIGMRAMRRGLVQASMHMLAQAGADGKVERLDGGRHEGKKRTARKTADKKEVARVFRVSEFI